MSIMPCRSQVVGFDCIFAMTTDNTGLFSLYSRPSLIQIAWDQHLFRLVKVEMMHFEWRDNLFLFNAHHNSHEYGCSD